ncbi:MAG: Crp/Fnr family transcriptional regulator [Bacteroidales bacterium]
MKGIYKSQLFVGLNPEEVDALLAGRITIRHYVPGDIIFLQGDRYRTLLIVDSGVVRGEMTNFAGDRVVIEEIEAPRPIAPAIIYASQNILPVDVIAVTETQIAEIMISDFTAILQADARVLHNFLRSISDRSKFLSDRVRMLRFGTIKSKLAGYLLEQMQGAKSTTFTIPHTQQELADIFGVTRPALSRAIGQLAEEGLLVSDKKAFTVLNPNRLRALLQG